MRVLLDERSRPPLRTVFGCLLGGATEADIAVARVRIAALDLRADELARLQRCRILVGRLDADALAIGARADDLARRFDALLRWLRSPAVEIRSAGLSAWTPDFSIYRGIRDGDAIRAVCLVGAHYFQQPLELGPSFTFADDHPASVRRASRRFEEIWRRAHDVRGAVTESIEQFACAVA